MSIDDEHTPVTRPEYLSLKEHVGNLATIMEKQHEAFSNEMREQREQSRRDKQDLQSAISDLSKSFHDAVSMIDRNRIEDNKERGKFPTGILTLIFSVITTVGMAATWNMSRIEQEAKERTKTAKTHSDDRDDRQDDNLKREMELINEATERAQSFIRQRVDLLESRVHSIEMEKRTRNTEQ